MDAEWGHCGAPNEYSLGSTTQIQANAAAWQASAFPELPSSTSASVLDGDEFASLADELFGDYEAGSASSRGGGSSEPDFDMSGSGQPAPWGVAGAWQHTATQHGSSKPRPAAPPAKRRGGRHPASREAQRRAEVAFRQRRQAQQQQLHASVAALQAEAARQAAANQALQVRAHVINTFIRIRDSFAAAQALDSAAPLPTGGPLSLQLPPPPAPATHAPCDHHHQHLQRQQQQQRWQQQALDAAASIPWLSKLVPAGGSQQAVAASCGGGGGGTAQLAALASVVSMWKAFVAAAMPLVLESSLAGKLSEASQRRLHDMAVRAAESGQAALPALRPEVAAAMLAVNIETGALCPPDHDWSRVIAAAEFSAEQKQEMAMAHEVSSERLAALLSEREQLKRRLAAMTGADPSDTRRVVCDQAMLAGQEHAAEGPGAAATTEGLIAALERNVRQEGTERQLLELYPLHMPSISSLQMARIAVISYPYPPSAASIMAQIHAEWTTASAASQGAVTPGGMALTTSTAEALPVPVPPPPPPQRQAVLPACCVLNAVGRPPLLSRPAEHDGR